ncbi:MAG: ABC transporter ATP-binding protein, partial [Candidatus Omnitrophota bacterium]
MLKKIMDNTKRNVNEINTCAVELKNVGERYNVFHHKIDSIKEKILKRMSIGKGTRQELWALKDISLTIKKGEVVGIIGENGSGKTTLLKLIAGILKPDRGNIHINGTIAAILQLGVGFHRDLTGRENIYLNGAMLGIDTETIKSKIDQMISFAELEDFIDMPLKTYSSGMEMRLGFSIAVNVDPDILLIDEVLIIGDVAFQQKCMHHIETLKGRGKTIVVVSHSMNLIDQMCDRTFLLRKGELICRGKTREVINYYYQCSGRKRGIALASYADVELIFNNGRLFIFWKKRAITPDPGMYVSITRGETRFYSFQAYWKMKTSSPTSFEAEGFLEALSTTITWKTNLGPDGSLYFDIHVQTEASAQEMDVKFITLFDSDYESWFCNVKRGVFSAMYHGDEMCLHSTMVRRGDFFGVDVAHDKDDVLPGMIFSMTEEKNIISFSHKAINGNSHCLELNFSKGKRRSALIKGNISLFTDITKIDEIVRRIEEKATIQNNTIRLHFDDYDSAIKVFYQDCEITQGKGFYTSLLYQNIWYNSSAMKWHRERVSPSSMKLIGTMPNIPVVQEWLFELHDNRLDVKTVMETTEGGTFSHPQLVVLANKEYNEWFQNISKGVCLDFRHDIPWEEIPLPHDISVDFFAIAQDKGDVPALIFTDYSKNPNIKRSLSNTMQQGPARAVSFISNAQVSRETFYIRFYFDEYDLLSNIVRAILGLYVLEILLAFEAHSITEGAVQVVFEEKQLRIFFDSEEVTGGVGFYSSLRVGNLWHNSSTMRWHYEKISSQCMKLTTTKKTPAVFQEFIFEVTKDALEIKAVMKTTDGNMFSQPQLVLLANKEYGEWFYNSAQGRCFDFKHDMISEEMPLPSDADVSFFALASDEGDKPAFTFTDCRKNGAGRIVLYNTLEHGAARALSFILDVQTSQEEFHVLVNFLSKATLKRLIQPKMQSILDSQSITSERLQVVFETQRWRVLFDGEEVTTGVGFYSLLKVNNIWYNSSSIKWQREKISPQCMKIRGVIRSASVHQEWLFEAKENELEIKLLMEADDSEFSNAQVVILAHKEYNEWFLNKSNGKCFDIKHDVRWEDIPLPSDAEMEFFAMTAKQKNIPGLMVAGCMNQGIQLNLSNTTQQGVGRALRFVSNKKLSREEFHVRFAFLSTKRLHKLISEKQKTLVEKNSITAGRIKILFNDDRLSIYADGKELSGGVGFYSLLQSNHNWYSSSTIKWEMEKVAPRCMKLTGCMKSISVKQE